jgi:hypothetical protein
MCVHEHRRTLHSITGYGRFALTSRRARRRASLSVTDRFSDYFKGLAKTFERYVCKWWRLVSDSLRESSVTQIHGATSRNLVDVLLD